MGDSRHRVSGDWVLSNFPIRVAKQTPNHQIVGYSFSVPSKSSSRVVQNMRKLSPTITEQGLSTLICKIEIWMGMVAYKVTVIPSVRKGIPETIKPQH